MRTRTSNITSCFQHMNQLHAMLESSKSCTCEGPSPVRTAPCTAALIPLLYQGCWTYSALWRWRTLDLDALSGIQVKPPTAPSNVCSSARYLCLARTSPRGPWNPGTSPCKALRSVLETTSTIIQCSAKRINLTGSCSTSYFFSS